MKKESAIWKWVLRNRRRIAVGVPETQNFGDSVGFVEPVEDAIAVLEGDNFAHLGHIDVARLAANAGSGWVAERRFGLPQQVVKVFRSAPGFPARNPVIADFVEIAFRFARED